MRRVRYESLRHISRQEIAFFDQSENSTGRLIHMLSTEATAMAALSGNNLGAILTLIVDIFGVSALAYLFLNIRLILESRFHGESV